MPMPPTMASCRISERRDAEDLLSGGSAVSPAVRDRSRRGRAFERERGGSACSSGDLRRRMIRGESGAPLAWSAARDERFGRRRVFPDRSVTGLSIELSEA